MVAPARVAVIGLGPMGAALARALLCGGHDVIVWNRTPACADAIVAEGAALADSPAAAIGAAPLTVMCVRNYAAAAAILASDGVAEALPDRTLLQLSSAAPEEVTAQDAWVRACGARFLAGGIMAYASEVGRPDAVIHCAGDAGAFDLHRRTLKTMAGGVQYLGPDPAAALAAYCAYGVFGLGAIALFLESAALARHYGIPIETYQQMCALEMKLIGTRMHESARRLSTQRLDGDDATLETTLAAMRDFRGAFQRTGMPSRMADACVELMETACAQGEGGRDIACLTEVVWAARRGVSS